MSVFYSGKSKLSRLPFSAFLIILPLITEIMTSIGHQNSVF